jgi:hypothetical protein
MMARAREALSWDREIESQSSGTVPFPLFPDPGGALPWARSDNGDVVYWLTRGDDPDRWPVAVWFARSGRREASVVEGGAAAFLSGWIGGGIQVDGFATPERRTFDPFVERVGKTLIIGGPKGEFDDRVAAIVAELAPVDTRGGFESPQGRQAHLVCADGKVRVTYDTLYGHNVRLAAPEAMFDEFRARLERVLAATGCTVTKVIRH